MYIAKWRDGVILYNWMRSQAHYIQLNKEISGRVFCGGVVLGCNIWKEKAAVNISAYCQHLHMDKKGRLCHFSLGLRLGPLTWLCPCQQHTFTQDVTYSGLFLLPTGNHSYSEFMSVMPVLCLEVFHSSPPHPPSFAFFPSPCSLFPET